MAWEYLEVKFGVRFGHGQIKAIQERFLGFGSKTKYLDVPREILWEVIAIVDPQKEVLLSGTIENSYEHSILQYDLKTVCFKYIQKLGVEGWEIVGEMPKPFIEASTNMNVTFQVHRKDEEDRKNEWADYVYLASHGLSDSIGLPDSRNNILSQCRFDGGNEYIIDIFGASFFFKRQK